MRNHRNNADRGEILTMANRLQEWWTLQPEEERQSADNPLTPLSDAQRRNTLPLLTLAFGWGFLVTGLLTGGALGKGMTFWPDAVQASFFGNLANFAIGAVVGYMGYKTACNSGLLYRLVYGRLGAYIPVLFIALLTIGWQGIVVGAFGFAWAQDFDSTTFYVVALLAGLLFTATTYFGVRALEWVSVPSVVVLVAVGLYSIDLNIGQAGGWDAFLALSAAKAANSESPLSVLNGVNVVIGSWIVGAVVMAEYTRFAKRAWVAIAIPFIVLIIAQWFLQLVGALGGVVYGGDGDFTSYLREQAGLIAWLGIIGMSVALWTTGDANLYLPVIQTSSIMRRPRRVMTVICGLLGTLLGLGIYQQFLFWIGSLAIWVPPLIGPVIAHYYFVARGKMDAGEGARLPGVNWAALFAYPLGLLSYYYAPEWLVPALSGLAGSMVAYLILYYLVPPLRGVAKA